MNSTTGLPRQRICRPNRGAEFCLCSPRTIPTSTSCPTRACWDGMSASLQSPSDQRSPTHLQPETNAVNWIVGSIMHSIHNLMTKLKENMSLVEAQCLPRLHSKWSRSIWHYEKFKQVKRCTFLAEIYLVEWRNVGLQEFEVLYYNIELRNLNSNLRVYI